GGRGGGGAGGRGGKGGRGGGGFPGGGGRKKKKKVGWSLRGMLSSPRFVFFFEHVFFPKPGIHFSPSCPADRTGRRAEHGREKRDHVPGRSWSGMTVRRKVILR